MKRKVILIRGLGHSGSTILDLSLSSHPMIVGLGEGLRVLHGSGAQQQGPQRLRTRERHQRFCTCGQQVSSCPIWGGILEWVISNDTASMPQKFSRLLSSVDSFHGGTPIILDSSQSDLKNLRWLTGDYDVSVILLVRDVRSWVWSRLKKTGGATWKHILHWYYFNRKFLSTLSDLNVRVQLIGYEELALRPTQTLKLICDRLNIDFRENMLTPASYHKSHIVAGNGVRNDREAISSITYDSSWIASSFIMRRAPLFAPLTRLNARWVYSNFDMSRRSRRQVTRRSYQRGETKQ